MSWNDNLSYQENLVSFLDSLTDYTKVNEDEYKVVSDLINRKKMLKLDIFRKQYGSILKRINKDTDNFQLKTKKDLIKLVYKDSTVFSFKPARYLSISDLLEKISKDIKNKEFQLREFRDIMISSNTEDGIIKKIENIRLELLGLYEKKAIIESVFNVLNNTDKYNQELQNKKDMLHKLRKQSIDLHKQMKEYYQKKDILNFQKTAKEIATLGITDLEVQITDLEYSRESLNNILVVRLPEIVENNEDVLKKQKKKTVKKAAKKKTEKKDEEKKDEDTNKQDEADKKKKTVKKSKTKEDKEAKGETEEDKEAKGETEEDKEAKGETVKGKSVEPSMVGGGINLLDSLKKTQSTVADEFDKKEEISMFVDIGSEQSGSGILNNDSNKTESVIESESFHTPPYSPSNQDASSPQLSGGAVVSPHMEMGNHGIMNESSDVKRVTISDSAMGHTNPEQIAGATMEYKEAPSSSVNLDPFSELQSVDMSGGSYSDMTNEINENMQGGGYGGSGSMDVFGSTYQQQQTNSPNTGMDPFGLNTTPPEIVSVTKLGA